MRDSAIRARNDSSDILQKVMYMYISNRKIWNFPWKYRHPAEEFMRLSVIEIRNSLMKISYPEMKDVIATPVSAVRRPVYLYMYELKIMWGLLMRSVNRSVCRT